MLMTSALKIVVERDVRAVRALDVRCEEIADRLETLTNGPVAAETWTRGSLRIKIEWITMGVQECPFLDAHGIPCQFAGGSAVFSVHNLRNARTVHFSGLLPHLIRNHHFFEGKVCWRLDPGPRLQGIGARMPRWRSR